jgi:acyl-CoA synthetase (AMP-forming)/AMP-acid ligase II
LDTLVKQSRGRSPNSVGSPTLGQVLGHAFGRHAASDCIVWEGGAATYQETAARVAATAAWLQSRVGPEGHVAILLDNSREYIEILLACMTAGCARVPLNVREPLQAQEFKLRDSQAQILFTNAEWWERLRSSDNDIRETVIVGGEGGGATGVYERLASRQGSFMGLSVVPASGRTRLTYTGGTTGRPKAVVQTHSRELAVARNLIFEAIRPGAGTTFVAATPLSHASGAFVLPTVLMGGALSWTTGFDPERLLQADWLGSEKRIQTFLVPTALDDLSGVANPRSHSVDTIVYGGATAPQAVIERAVDRLGPRIVQVYGQAEAPMTITVLRAEDHVDPQGLEGCVGRPFLFVDVRVDGSGNRPGAIGEVFVSGEHLMHSYWRQPTATRRTFAENGSIGTQDLGYFDEQGRLWLAGRSREMIISGGYNVYPAQVERQLGTVPGVRALAVFGVPHPRWGEGVVVAVEPESSESLDRIRSSVEARAQTNLANYERPKRVIEVSSLPKTPVGKVSRTELAATFADLFAGADAD